MATTSFFTKILVKRLEGDGASVPDSILALLDTPFSQFSEEEQRLYQEQLQKNQLETAFSRLLKIIYSETVKSGRHSWKAMYHMVKDTPIKRCVSFLAEEEEGEEVVRAAGAPAGDKKTTPKAEAQKQVDGGPRKSFFTKKLEYMFEERGVDFPPAITRLLDTPFDDFTEEQKALYKNDFKGRHLSVLLGDMLQELYEKMGKSKYGWDSACRYLKDTPMKVCALYVMQEEERLEQMPESPQEAEAVDAGPARKKYNVKPYHPASKDKQ
jgi:hypothetical protein